MKYVTCLLLFGLFTATATYGQSLSELRWQNRVLIVMIDHESTQHWEHQLSELANCQDDVKERRIVVYQALPDRYRVVAEQESPWIPSDELYRDYKSTTSKVEVVLLGLDGGIKLRESDIVTCNQLSALIDQMPMRRAEIERQNKTK